MSSPRERRRRRRLVGSFILYHERFEDIHFASLHRAVFIFDLYISSTPNVLANVRDAEISLAACYWLGAKFEDDMTALDVRDLVMWMRDTQVTKHELIDREIHIHIHVWPMIYQLMPVERLLEGAEDNVKQQVIIALCEALLLYPCEDAEVEIQRIATRFPDVEESHAHPHMSKALRGALTITWWGFRSRHAQIYTQLCTLANMHYDRENSCPD